MSEEESFVILGSASAPNSSFQQFAVDDDELNPLQSERSDQQQHTNMMPNDPYPDLPSNDIQQSSLNSEASINSNENDKLKYPLQISNNSFAASFIIGDLQDGINLSQPELKEADSTEFASLFRDGLDSNDNAKLKKLIEDFNSLKDNLIASNLTMMRCVDTIEKLKAELRDHKETHEKDIKDCRVLIEDLQTENKMMKLALESAKTLEKNIEQLEENIEKVEKVNELVESAVSNTNQLNDDNNDKQNKIEPVGMISVNEAVIPVSEHDKLMSAKDKSISEVLAANAKLKNEIQKMFDEMMALRHQADVYRSDFQEAVKLHRKTANDRNQLIKDVANLQKRLEACVGFATKKKSNGEKTKISKGDNLKMITAEKKDSEEKQFVCPICEKEFEGLQELHTHVQKCIDKKE